MALVHVSVNHMLWSPPAAMPANTCPAPPAGRRKSGSRGQERIILTTQFSQFNLSAPLMARLNANKFEIPTPVQAGCIPPALEGRDVLATAQTGTGKTLGYLIPIVEMMQKAEGKGAQALICLPTRELAMQVEQAFLAIRTNSSQSVALVVGGLAEHSQLNAIRRGARLIVATPGRLEDFLKRKMIRLEGVKILVLDEATASLDSESEVVLQEAVSKVAEGRTLLVIAHRLSTVQQMDSIVVLDDGVLVEKGCHEELLARNGRYASLHRSGTLALTALGV